MNSAQFIAHVLPFCLSMEAGAQRGGPLLSSTAEAGVVGASFNGRRDRATACSFGWPPRAVPRFHVLALA